MVKGRLIEELDQAVERIIRNPDAPLPDADSRIAPLIRVAAQLRDLPATSFKTRLGGALLSRGLAPTQSTASGSICDGDGQTELAPRNALAAIEGLPEMEALPLGKLDDCMVGVTRLSDQKPRWERHPGGDELLHVLDGELDVTTLTDDGAVQTRVPAGSVFVCPLGLWRWTRPVGTASVLFVRPGKGTENSLADKPRPLPKPRVRTGQPTVAAQLIARDIRDALSRAPTLAIDHSTTGEQAAAAFPRLGSLNECGLYAGRFSGLSPWERHATADELLHVLEGEVEITTLTDNGPVRNTLRPGSVFICPRGLWHRQYSGRGALEFSATPQPTEVSFADDPRVQSG